VCQLVIVTAELVLSPGAPGAFVPAATRAYSGPEEVSAPIQAKSAVSMQVAYRKNLADPVRDVLGPGRLSHPDEWHSTLENLKKAGVEIMLTPEERLAYALGTRPSNPGQIHLHQDASIGALRHEYQHFLDDQAAGFLGTRGLYDLAFRKQTEQNAYNIEINMMEQMGEQQAIEQLRQNLSDELKRLELDLGEIEID
jgi:hypothetical protein